MRATNPARILLTTALPLALLLICPTVASAKRSTQYVVKGYNHSRALPIGTYRPRRLRVFGKRHRATVCPDPSAIRRVIRKHLGPVRRCYQKHALAKNPKSAGRVVVRFTIGTDGRVTAVRVHRSDLAHKPTERCLEKALGRMRFPKINGIIHVMYPFRFKPR